MPSAVWDLSTRYATKDEMVLAMATEARRELKEWAQQRKSSWRSDTAVAQIAFMMTWMGRFFGFGRWWLTGPGYLRTFSRLGGESRIQLLLTIARFDADGSGDISKEELADYHKFGEALVANVVNTFQNFAVVFTLLIGATHMQTIGRPAPWSPPAAFIDMYGQTAADGMLVTAYVLNAFLETMCIATLLCCIFLRFLITNALTTLDSKIVFMVGGNVLANTVAIAVYCVFCLVILMCVAAVLSQPRWGWIVVGLFPVFNFLLMRLIARWFCEVVKRQHDEAVAIVFDAPSKATSVISHQEALASNTQIESTLVIDMPSTAQASFGGEAGLFVSLEQTTSRKASI